MLHVVRGWGETLPAACHGTCAEIWAVFDQFLAKYGLHFPLADSTSRVLRQGLQLFSDAVLPIVPSVMARMTSCFETSGFSCYLWINSKIMGVFGQEEAPEYRALYKDTFTRCSAKVVQLMQTKSTHELPDGAHLPLSRRVDAAADVLRSPRGLQQLLAAAV